jgi:hypothetical protein
MKEDRGREVIIIHPYNYQKIVKKFIPLLILLEVLLLFVSISMIIAEGFNPLAIFLFYFGLLPNILLFPGLFMLFYEPLIIYNNGIIKGESKIKTKVIRRTLFINFKKIVSIDVMRYDKAYMHIRFVLKNNKMIYQFINDQKEYEIITATYKKYKDN